MVDLSGRVAEGEVPGTDDQRAEALRLFGIGQFLRGRRDGAERAFVDLLKLRPHADLDPAVTRPEVVAFFRDVRRRNRPKKYKALAFVPPLGQFQNGHRGRGWLFAGLEAVTAGAALTTFIMYRSGINANEVCTINADMSTGPCDRLKLMNLIAGGAFLAVYATGVIDGLVNFDDEGGDVPSEPRMSFAVFPTGAAFRLRF